MLRHTVDGSGPPVLLLHGFALDARMWRPQVRALAGAYRVITVDLPGFGPSPTGAGDATTARAIVDTLDALTSEPAHVAGLSLGGAVAVDLALAFPHRVRSLTLIDAVLLRHSPGARAWPAAAALAKEGKLSEAREAWLADPLFAAASARPDVLSVVREMVDDYSGDHWSGRATTRFEVTDPAARLAEIACPTLVLVGEHDLPSFRAMADAYAAAIARATLEVIPGAGHLASMEAPDAVNARMGRFLAEA